MDQHCIASTACLLSSMKLLSQQRQQSFRVLVRGVYGLQLYATEYWTEYLLAIVGRNGGLDRDSTLHSLLYQLSAGIDAASQNDRDEDYRDDPSQDNRLDHLKEHQSIYENVRKAIWTRSLQHLEQCLRSEGCELFQSLVVASDIDDLKNSIARRCQGKVCTCQGRRCVFSTLTISELAAPHHERAGYPWGVIPRTGSLSK